MSKKNYIDSNLRLTITLDIEAKSKLKKILLEKDRHKRDNFIFRNFLSFQNLPDNLVDGIVLRDTSLKILSWSGEGIGNNGQLKK